MIPIALVGNNNRVFKKKSSYSLCIPSHRQISRDKTVTIQINRHRLISQQLLLHIMGVYSRYIRCTASVQYSAMTRIFHFKT